jgi:hypothetical protein
VSEITDWYKMNAHGIPPEKVLFFKYKHHPSPTGRAMYSPDVKKWCGFWPDGTPLTGCDEETGMERQWFWDTEEDVMAIIRDAYPTVEE